MPLLQTPQSSKLLQRINSTESRDLLQRQAVKFTRKNDDLLPFEAGGEAKLEHFASKTDCGQFVLASHTKKRPHNLILGRFFDHRLYDLLEVGVVKYRAIKSFGAAASAVQAENKVGAHGSASSLTCEC